MKKIILGAMIIASSSTVMAATTNTTMQVTAEVVKVCVVSATIMSFGDVDFSKKEDLRGSNTITVKCSKDLPYKLNLSKGSGESVSSRSMLGSDTVSRLAYNIMSDDTTSGLLEDLPTKEDSTIAKNGTGENQTYDLLGRIEVSKHPFIAKGSYVDTLTVSLEY